MPLTRLPVDIFGVLTISSVLLLAVFSLFCVYRYVYFSFQTRKHDLHFLGYFNGPWVTRIALIVIALLWGFGEIVRLSFLRESLSHFSSLHVQKILCKFYVASNLGFAEPCIILTICFLLNASLQRREFGALRPRWNMSTICCILLFCLPFFTIQVGIIFLGPKLVKDINGEVIFSRYFFNTSYLTKDREICTYPLLNSTLLGIFNALAMSYILCFGARLLSLAINTGLRRRAHVLVFSCIVLLPSRVVLLGFSVLLHPGKFGHEFIIFLAFCTFTWCTLVGVHILVYHPVTDSLALRYIERREMVGDNFCHEVHNVITSIQCQSHSAGRSSNTSTKCGSVSFRTLIRGDTPIPNVLDETSSPTPMLSNNSRSHLIAE